MQNYKYQLPMIATYGRIVASIPLVIFMHLGSHWLSYGSTILFLLAAISDWLDGYWARKYKCESAMGKFMDPIADKIIVSTALILLLKVTDIPSELVILLLARDTFIGGIRSVAASNQIIIAAKPFGKWKTAFQMVAIPCLYLSTANHLKDLPLYDLGHICLWISVFLSLISGVEYTYGYYKGRNS